MGPVTAATPLIAQSLGADPNDHDDVRLSFRMTAWTIIAIQPIAYVVSWYSNHFVMLLGHARATCM